MQPSFGNYTLTLEGKTLVAAQVIYPLDGRGGLVSTGTAATDALTSFARNANETVITFISDAPHTNVRVLRFYHGDGTLAYAYAKTASSVATRPTLEDGILLTGNWYVTNSTTASTATIGFKVIS